MGLRVPWLALVAIGAALLLPLGALAGPWGLVAAAGGFFALVVGWQKWRAREPRTDLEAWYDAQRRPAARADPFARSSARAKEDAGEEASAREARASDELHRVKMIAIAFALSVLLFLDLPARAMGPWARAAGAVAAVGLLALAWVVSRAHKAPGR